MVKGICILALLAVGFVPVSYLVSQVYAADPPAAPAAPAAAPTPSLSARREQLVAKFQQLQQQIQQLNAQSEQVRGQVQLLDQLEPPEPERQGQP
jgi:TolA-binding protein